MKEYRTMEQRRVFDRLTNWWEQGDQDRPCIVMSHLQDGHTLIPQTENLGTYWTDLDFRIHRRMKILANTAHYGEAVPYHYIDFGASAMPGVLGAEYGRNKRGYHLGPSGVRIHR